MKTQLARLVLGALSGLAIMIGVVAPHSLRADDPAPDDKGPLFSTVAVPAGFTQAQVQDVVVTTLLGRQWGIKSKADNQVVGFLQHRGHEATVTLVFDDKSVQIYCVGYKIDSKTLAHEKPDQPKGWLKNIANDLAKNFQKKPSTS